MSVFDDMARDGGYRGDEARQVAREGRAFRSRAVSNVRIRDRGSVRWSVLPMLAGSRGEAPVTPSERERRISEEYADWQFQDLVDECVSLRTRAERAEAAARDFAETARNVLARHPFFSGEEGTEG